MLAHALNRSVILSGKKVLIIDSKENPCQGYSFGSWTQNNELYDNIALATWEQINIIDRNHTIPIKNNGYKYRLINGNTLYSSIIDELKKNPDMCFIKSSVVSISDEVDGAVVVTSDGLYGGNYVFNSLPPDFKEIEQQKDYITMWQHFKALEITTHNNSFDPSAATLMDFRVEQDNITRFAHVLPFDKNRAFVEIVSFDTQRKSRTDFDDLLKAYIANILKIDDYVISYTESGIIPMTEYPFKKKESEHIINLGIKSGAVKPSTGYSFKRILSDIEKIIDLLEIDENPALESRLWNKRFKLYDSTLLDVLNSNRIKGSELFTELFSKNKPENILKFLDEETNVLEEISIFCKVKVIPFIKSIVLSVARQIKRSLQPVGKIKKMTSPLKNFDISLKVRKEEIIAQDA